MASTRDLPAFSVIIPTWNERRVIGETLREVSAYLRRTALTYELIVCDDGSTDGTLEAVREYSASDPTVNLVAAARHEGKGAAVRHGMQEARGGVVAFIDADFPYRLQDLGDALALVQSEATDITIGSRPLRGAERDPAYSAPRRAASRLFSAAVRALLVPRVVDTRCGLKAFSITAAKLLFAESKLSGYGFDLEILYLANKYGLRVECVPAAVARPHLSRLRPLRDGIPMLFDIYRIRMLDRRLAYRAARRCPVCFSSDVWTLLQLPGRLVRECHRCHCRYRNVFPPIEELEAMHRQNCRAGTPDPEPSPAEAVQRTAMKRAAFVRRLLPAQGRLLEIGAGEGLLGRFLGREFDYVGLDTCEATARAARSAGVPVYCARLSEFVNTGGPFDAVALLRGFSQLADPHDALARIHELLKPGGVMAITTPDAEGLFCALSGDRWPPYESLDHLILYSRSALIELLERSGFEIASASADFHYATHEAIHSRLRSTTRLGAALTSAALRFLPDPLNVATGSIRIVARRRSGSPRNMRSVRAVEATHAR
jgi:dolichyl-phosphate beta-glucosyltransferase